VPVYAPEGAALPGLDVIAPGLDVIRVSSGEDFTAAGFRVTAVGGRHATIYGGEPDCANLGYVVDDDLYHPGDSLALPGRPVRTLLVPAQGSWLKLAEAIDFVRAIGPARTFPIHDAQVNDRGRASINGWFTERTDAGYRWLAPRETA